MGADENDPTAWSWREGSVDPTREHFELQFESIDRENHGDLTLVARVGLPRGGVFPVEFVVALADSRLEHMMTAIRRELDFYLVEKGEPNPVAYVRYHCGTAANLYSSVHWSFNEAQESRKNREWEFVCPVRWATEYRNTGLVLEWVTTFPSLFKAALENLAHPGKLTSRPGTLDLFAQYALQFVLRDREGINSITWYKLAGTSVRSKNRIRTLGHWHTMQQIMGKETFARLQNAVRAAGFRSLAGEPDLFCWSPSGEWFFAEAKSTDRIGSKQKEWFRVCEQTVGIEVRVYRLKQESTARRMADTDSRGRGHRWGAGSTNRPRPR